MPTYEVQDGDTWASIAQAFETPVSWLMLHNGQDPNASPPPDDPEAGTTLNVPGDPPAHSIAPENDNSLDLGAGGLDSVRIRLHDCQFTPMQNVRYSASYTGGGLEGVSDDGWVTLNFPAGVCTSVELEWGAPDDDSPHPYQMTVVADCAAGTWEDQATARLGNLGYDMRGDLESAVRAFQSDYEVDESGLADDGTLPPQTQSALDQIFAGECDASLPSSS